VGGRKRSENVIRPEGFGRQWGRPSRPAGESPRCVVKVEFLSHNEGQLRGELDTVAFCEYIVGGPTAHGQRSTSGAVVSKGRGGDAVRLFASHPKQDVDFATKWLARDPSLGGHDGSRWKVEDAWCVHLMRKKLSAARFRRSPVEQRHYRIRFCPETSAGNALAESEQMEEAARRFMGLVEQDYGGKFWWIGAAHYNTDQPHVHIGVRGIDVNRDHVYFSQQYLRPTERELKANPDASSPIEWRARSVLAEMLSTGTGVRHAG
jgi:hypothetical protein